MRTIARRTLVCGLAAGALLVAGPQAHASTTVLIYVLPDTVTGGDTTYNWAGETCGLVAVPNPLGGPNSYTGVFTAGPWVVLDAHQIVVSYNPVGVDAGASSITITCTLRGASAFTATFPSNGPAAAPTATTGSFTWAPPSVLELCTTVSWTPTSATSPYVHGCVPATTIESPVP